tara:strand:- start:166 stop:594 length:429 start_codon:yes stop_codon:yes gene_type:complete
MATTTASVAISSSDLQPGNQLSINANSTIMKTGLTTGLELMDMGKGHLTQASGADSLHEALGTADTSNWVYICNNATDDTHYMKVGIHDTVIGNLGSGDWMWMPWNMGTTDNEINIEAEPTGATIPYEYAIFKSSFTLPAKT